MVQVSTDLMQSPVESSVITAKWSLGRARRQHWQIKPRLRPRQRHIEQPPILILFFAIQPWFLDRLLGVFADCEAPLQSLVVNDNVAQVRRLAQSPEQHHDTRFQPLAHMNRYHRYGVALAFQTLDVAIFDL